MGNYDRLFVAIWPHPHVLDQVVQVQSQFKLSRRRRCIDPQNIHLTRVFLGMVPAHHTQSVADAVSELSFSPFDIDFEVLSCWLRSQIAWIGCQQPCQPLSDSPHFTGKAANSRLM